jgi:hypothetical protein
VQAIFDCQKPSEKISFMPFQKLSNKFLLWHGVRASSVVATMREGLRMPSVESSVGLMFGRGIYLTDSFSKAANVSLNQSEAAVFLAEAALGEMHRAYEPD